VSNHFSAASLKPPGGDPRLDFTDLYAFISPEDADKTLVIMDSDPFLLAPAFHPDAVYRLDVDTDGDARPDVAFSFVFSALDDGAQTATACYATGGQARRPEAVGNVLIAGAPVGFDDSAQPVRAGAYQFFFGVRSDPFFADGEAPFHGYQWTGVDTFAGKNILTIAVEAPSEMFGVDPAIGLWGTISLRRNGKWVQMDRGGNPSMNPFINPDDEKDLYNSRQPVDDVANYLAPWSTLLRSNGYPPEEAEAAAMLMLPDVLRYDRSQPVAYPNGRGLTDDVYSWRHAWLTHDRVGSQGIGPHTDLLTAFPYLGLPNS
jgi:hypothetical protein